MADMNKKEDRTQAPKSRPRPEVKRPIVPPPGGLPMPPSRQQSVQQPGGLSLPPSTQQSVQQSGGLSLPSSTQQSVPSSSSMLSGYGTTTSNIAAPGILPRPSENPPLSGTTPIDLFGLPDFRFSIPSTSKTGFGFSGNGFSSIKSPTHLPRLANIKIPNLFGNLASRSGIAGSNLTSGIHLPRPPNARSSRNQTTRDLPGTGASSTSTAEDLPRRAKRPTDLPLFNVTGTNLSSDPGANDIPGTSNNFPRSRTSKESHKSSNTTHTSDRAPASNLPTSHIPEPSTTEGNPVSSNLPEASAINLPSTSASIHLPGPSSSFAMSDPNSLQGKRDVKRSSDPTTDVLPGPSKIKRTADSMPSISQHPDALPKSKSILGKFKRFVRKGLRVKKKGGPEDKEESTGLVFEREEDEQEPRPQPHPRDPDENYRYFTTKTYNHALDRDPILPNSEVEKICYVCENRSIGSPTISMISDTSKSEPDLVSIGNPASEVAQPISRSNPTSPAAERKCTCNSASETSEQASAGNPTAGNSGSTSASNPTAGNSESTSASNPTAGNSGSTSASNPTAGNSESTSASNPTAENSGPASVNNPIADNSESALANNPIAEVSKSSSTSNPKTKGPEPLCKN